MKKGSDKWDLDIVSLVSRLRSGIHVVNGTTAVSLTEELHARSHTKFFFDTISLSGQGYGRSQRLERDLGQAELRVL